MTSHPFLLWSILFLGGYLAAFAALQQDLPKRRLLPALALATLMVYFCATAFTGLMYNAMDGDLMVFYLVLVIYGICIAVYLAGQFWKDRHDMNRQILFWLVLDLLAVFYVTLGSRLVESHGTGTRLIPFVNLLRAVETGSFQPLEHSFLNLLLFLPAGFLMGHLSPRRCRRIELGFLAGLVLSTAIETTQLLARLGLCDINDIVANALGAGVGVLAHNVIFPRWKRPRT